MIIVLIITELLKLVVLFFLFINIVFLGSADIIVINW